MGDSRRGHLKERGDDTFQGRVEQGNSNSSVIMPTVKFYDNNHNFQFGCWIGLVPKFFLNCFLCSRKISGQLEFGKALRYRSKQAE